MAGKGGAQPGAGRKPGVPNKDRREAIAKAKAGGEMPLDYMLRVMRDKRQKAPRRDAMASAAAPYLHPRLQAIQHSGDVSNPVQLNIFNKPVNPKRKAP